ncbi:MAG: methylmalonyl Co-A mutase-associated GTPase MeaB [Acidobacteria bacterium]|nr:methylmalonyl Co-A mutase-associated GTPase MeaB [Acidobacteriota bacterium]
MASPDKPATRESALKSIADFASEIRSGDQRIIAKAASLVEDFELLVSELKPFLGVPDKLPPIIGITGSPGVGKSTTTSALINLIRKNGESVAIVAIDPSSAITGGALLGDRIRLTHHFSDKKVFIRSLATRGALGGLSNATDSVVYILSIAGFDNVIIETVGVGQSEIEVMRHADTVMVVLAPGMGDGIQAAKAGVMEIGDLYLINKEDRGGADEVAREVERSLALSAKDANWKPPVLIGSMENETGASAVLAAIHSHLNYLHTKN